MELYPFEINQSHCMSLNQLSLKFMEVHQLHPTSCMYVECWFVSIWNLSIIDQGTDSWFSGDINGNIKLSMISIAFQIFASVDSEKSWMQFEHLIYDSWIHILSITGVSTDLTPKISFFTMAYKMINHYCFERDYVIPNYFECGIVPFWKQSITLHITESIVPPIE